MQVTVKLGDHPGPWGIGRACNRLGRRWGRSRLDVGLRLAQWERHVRTIRAWCPRGQGTARGRARGGSSPGDNGSPCPWGASPPAASGERKEQPDPQNVTVLFPLQVSRGSRAPQRMEPVSSRCPPGPTRSRSSPNKPVSLELSSRESLLSWGGAAAPSLLTSRPSLQSQCGEQLCRELLWREAQWPSTRSLRMGTWALPYASGFQRQHGLPGFLEDPCTPEQLQCASVLGVAPRSLKATSRREQ